MLYTSAEAAKLLKRLNEEHDAVLNREIQSQSFLASVGEVPDSVRPDYNYAETQEKLKEIERKIRIVKHCINQFNITHIVPGFNMTVDQMLIYIPQLTATKTKLYSMKSVLPKTRDTSGSFSRSGNIIDYRYANYDVSIAEKDFNLVSDALAKAQTALDLINSTETMEIEF